MKRKMYQTKCPPARVYQCCFVYGTATLRNGESYMDPWKRNRHPYAGKRGAAY